VDFKETAIALALTMKRQYLQRADGKATEEDMLDLRRNIEAKMTETSKCLIEVKSLWTNFLKLSLSFSNLS
jgi:hypothetical protein